MVADIVKNQKYQSLKEAVITKGDNVFVYDDRGNKYLDAASGVGVVNIGHGVDEIVEQIYEQAQKLSFSYAVNNDQRELLNDKLQQWSVAGMGKTMSSFCSGGSEANEGALKFAYLYHCEKGNHKKNKIISRWQSYHGNTIGTLSMSGRTSWKRVFSPYMLDFSQIHPPYCYRCPYELKYPACQLHCAYELEKIILQNGPENICAFIAEAVIGTSMSAVVPPPEYYKIIRKICDKYDIILIIDEVMSGIGRTGKKFAIEHWGISPDIVTIAKGFSGGYTSLGATILSEEIWKTLENGKCEEVHPHTFTYGGNPLSCSVGLAVLNYIEDQNLIELAAVNGEKLIKKLREELEGLEWVGQIRGKGLFIGIELVADKNSREPFSQEKNITKKLTMEAFNNGLIIIPGADGLINGAAGDHIELVPPYIIDDNNIAFITNTLKESIQNIMK